MEDTKKILIGTFLVIVMIGGYLMVSDKNLLNNSTVTGTAASLLSLDKDITCTFEYTKDGQVMNGVLYVTRDKNMRGDFVTTHPQNGSIETHTLQKGGYVYSWGIPGRDNFKTKIDENSNDANKIRDKYNSKVSDKSDVQYVCKPWRVDPSLFELPENIVFKEKVDNNDVASS